MLSFSIASAKVRLIFESASVLEKKIQKSAFFGVKRRVSAPAYGLWILHFTQKDTTLFLENPSFLLQISSFIETSCKKRLDICINSLFLRTKN
jgi:hypothetical protein